MWKSKRIRREPLAEKLKSQAGAPAAFGLFTEDFFKEVQRMGSGDEVWKCYTGHILPVTKKLGRDTSMEQMAEIATHAPDKRQEEILYSLLVGPLAALCRAEKNSKGKDT